MNHDIMTIEEVAEYLRVSERTVYDWAKKGQLPGGKLGTTWRFKRADIEAWVSRQLGPVPPAVTPAPSGPLSQILSADRVVFLEDREKNPALIKLAGVLAQSPLVHQAEALVSSILRREELMSTGIGFGVGVPHVRIDSVDDVVMAMGIAREPIADYASLDGQPVQIVCMVAAGSTQHAQYIRTLSAISNRLKDAQVRTSLIQAGDAETAYELFTGKAA